MLRCKREMAIVTVIHNKAEDGRHPADLPLYPGCCEHCWLGGRGCEIAAWPSAPPSGETGSASLFRTANPEPAPPRADQHGVRWFWPFSEHSRALPVERLAEFATRSTNLENLQFCSCPQSLESRRFSRSLPLSPGRLPNSDVNTVFTRRNSGSIMLYIAVERKCRVYFLFSDHSVQ